MWNTLDTFLGGRSKRSGDLKGGKIEIGGNSLTDASTKLDANVRTWLGVS